MFYLVTAMPKSAIESEVFTIKQVANYLKVTERTIYRLAAAKKIPAFKVGGTWRFSHVDIERWIKQQSMGGLATDGNGEDMADGQSNDRVYK